MEAYLEDNRPTLDDICKSYKECCKECPAYEVCKQKVRNNMADIELVIKIPEEMYTQIIDENSIDTMLIPYTDIIKKGTPLPEGHGRLIILSEDAVKSEQMPLSFSCQKWISEVGLSNATVTIIEADKAEK